MTVEKTVNLLTDMLRSTHAKPCEMIYEEVRQGVTRFAGDRIHQSTETEMLTVTVRLLAGGRAGICRTSRFDQDALARAVQQAYAMAVYQRAIPNALTLSGDLTLASACRGTFQAGYDASTARAQPFERAQILHDLIDAKAGRGPSLSGAITTARETLSVVSTNGTGVFEERTRAEVNLVAQQGNSSGRGFWTGWKLNEAPLARLLDEALAAADPGLEPAEPPLGSQPVVLDYLAAGQLLGAFGYLGFGAKAYLEKRSFLAHALGERVAPDFFSMSEKPQAVLPRGFDFNGMPKKDVALVKNGVTSGMVTDHETARLLEQENTGHAPPPDSTEGPLPENLVVSGGSASLDELLAAVGNGIYVRDLHYLNIVEPLSTTVTGMTRHGTFRIRDGQLAERLPALRFQVAILDVLRNLVGMTGECRPAEGFGILACVPALASGHFVFTAKAEMY
jgi:predicted Zn-dependent protease